MPLRMLDMFSGIAGFSLAARWTGQIETVQFCEIDPFCCAVIAKNFPGVPIDHDINDFDARPLLGTIDILCGGFPCQGNSDAGKGAGLQDARSGLWFQLLRVICECRPRVCLIENVPGIRTKPGERDGETAIDTVLRGLEEAGYLCGAFVVGADDAGATHRRKRVWIVAYREDTELLPTLPAWRRRAGLTDDNGALADLSIRRDGRLSDRQQDKGEPGQSESLDAYGNIETMADPDNDIGNRRPERDGTNVIPERWQSRAELAGSGYPFPFPPRPDDFRSWAAVASLDPSLMPCTQRGDDHLAHGLSKDMVRRRRRTRNATLKALGNSIVPQVAYLFLSHIVTELLPAQNCAKEGYEQPDQSPAH
jgi:DNA (cytosine-5)-methyltransferase 1